MVFFIDAVEARVCLKQLSSAMESQGMDVLIYITLYNTIAVHPISITHALMFMLERLSFGVLS